jgi:hypothetical protein
MDANLKSLQIDFGDEGWPNFVFDMLNDEYVGAFQGSVVVGPNGGDLYVP